MKVKEYYICEKCDKPILDEKKGFVLEGVIKRTDYSVILGSAETATAYCFPCFVKALNLNVTLERDSISSGNTLTRKGV